MVTNQHSKGIFEQLRGGETIASNNPEAYKLQEASFATKKLLIPMNNSSDPAKVRDLLSQITGSTIDESVVVFTPLYINYGKNTKIGKNVFINFDCVFLDFGGITIGDNVLRQMIGNHLFPDIFTSKKMLGLVQVLPYFQE
jgi:hypothetical protein